MAFAFYRKPLLLSTKTLKTLVENFSSYTKPLEITENEEELFHKHCTRTQLPKAKRRTCFPNYKKSQTSPSSRDS
ncbi:hypothetical protein Aduo_011820 [Ancylostoma duodenale]